MLPSKIQYCFLLSETLFEFPKTLHILIFLTCSFSVFPCRLTSPYQLSNITLFRVISALSSCYTFHLLKSSPNLLLLCSSSSGTALIIHSVTQTRYRHHPWFILPHPSSHATRGIKSLSTRNSFSSYHSNSGQYYLWPGLFYSPKGASSPPTHNFSLWYQSDLLKSVHSEICPAHTSLHPLNYERGGLWISYTYSSMLSWS